MDNKDKDVKASKEMIKLRHKLVYDIEYRFNQLASILLFPVSWSTTIS